jgi:thioredoxin 1|tara:strand:- start:2667 stop:3005 length:339 start_codon:yes stop_codon:yes gene_type:complete
MFSSNINNSFQSGEDLSRFSSANNDTLIMLYFTASWCGPCKKIKPFIDEKQKEFKNVCFSTINVDDNDYEDLCNDFSISAMPTFVFYKNNSELDKVVGVDETKIESLLNTHK